MRYKTVVLSVIIGLLSFAYNANGTMLELMTYQQCVSVFGGTGTCVDRANQFYDKMGYTGTLYDKEMAYLGGLGYTGSWGDRVRALLSGFPGAITEKVRGYGDIADGMTFYAPFSNPSSPLSLPLGTGPLAITRASTAQYLHPVTGLITSVSNNVLRIESKGALISGGITNVCLQSEDLGTTWAAAGGATAVAVDQGVAPDGNTTADQVTFAAAAPSLVYQFNTNILGVSSVEWSAWVKYVSGASTFRFRYSTAGGDVYSSDITATSEWARYGWSSTSDGNVLQLALANNAAGEAGVFLFWGEQVEEATFRSSYVPTTTIKLSNNADDLTVASSGAIDNTVGSLSVDWSPTFASTMTTGAEYPIFDIGGVKAYYNATDQKVYLTDGTNTISTAAQTFSAGDVLKVAFRWGSGGLDIYKNGSSAATGASFTEPALNANLYIGSNVASSAYLFGNLKNLRIWNRELSDAEMQAITS